MTQFQSPSISSDFLETSNQNAHSTVSPLEQLTPTVSLAMITCFGLAGSMFMAVLLPYAPLFALLVMLASLPLFALGIAALVVATRNQIRRYWRLRKSAKDIQVSIIHQLVPIESRYRNAMS